MSEQYGGKIPAKNQSKSREKKKTPRWATRQAHASREATSPHRTCHLTPGGPACRPRLGELPAGPTRPRRITWPTPNSKNRHCLPHVSAIARRPAALVPSLPPLPRAEASLRFPVTARATLYIFLRLLVSCWVSSSSSSRSTRFALSWCFSRGRIRSSRSRPLKFREVLRRVGGGDGGEV